MFTPLQEQNKIYHGQSYITPPLSPEDDYRIIF
jgi:hypothetical protein